MRFQFHYNVTYLKAPLASLLINYSKNNKLKHRNCILLFVRISVLQVFRNSSFSGIKEKKKERETKRRKEIQEREGHGNESARDKDRFEDYTPGPIHSPSQRRPSRVIDRVQELV
ncbi:hypothetical protein NPIL_12581 [Nephila pilipes]|uniref:Uncharacterized protein n=1 Tax=Nephila pilipes TaxID=299642 RepID=A0A8X6QRJ9_NEPPI|nr:hypothetical protein NPIL_12581 [Nephila pilipes]